MIYLQRILLATSLFLLPCFVENAFACQCSLNPPSCANFSKADAVFVGTVTKVLDDNTVGLGVRKVHFSIKQSFRGVQGTEVELRNGITSCEMTFDKGKTYFVYAYGDATKGFGTHLCSGTQEITDATEDLKYAENHANGVVEQSVVGRILEREDVRKPVAGVKVIVSGKGKSYSAFTDKTGSFKIVVGEPGKYKVRLFLPKNSRNFFAEDENIVGSRATRRNYILDYEFEINSGKCAFADVYLIIGRSAR